MMSSSGVSPRLAPDRSRFKLASELTHEDEATGASSEQERELERIRALYTGGWADRVGDIGRITGASTLLDERVQLCVMVAAGSSLTFPAPATTVYAELTIVLELGR